MEVSSLNQVLNLNGTPYFGSWASFSWKHRSPSPFSLFYVSIFNTPGLTFEIIEFAHIKFSERLIRALMIQLGRFSCFFLLLYTFFQGCPPETTPETARLPPQLASHWYLVFRFSLVGCVEAESCIHVFTPRPGPRPGFPTYFPGLCPLLSSLLFPKNFKKAPENQTSRMQGHVSPHSLA